MSDTFLAVQDQVRSVLGNLLLLFILCDRSLSRHPRFWPRVAFAVGVSLAAGLFYLPLSDWLGELPSRIPTVTAPYWLVMGFLPVWVIRFCFETGYVGALFRTMMAAFTENIVTSLVRYLFVQTFFPDFPREHWILYSLLMIGVYAVTYLATYRTMGRRIQDQALSAQAERSAGWQYTAAFLLYSAVLSAAKVVSEFVLVPIQRDPALRVTYLYLQFFLILLMLSISFVTALLLWNAYQRAAMRNEKQILLQMARDRESQFEFSKENIEMIRRKAHDLKHQLKALEQVSDEERREQIRQTRKAIDFYDAVVQTGNPALDTLLTEKSVYCQNRNIRLSCMVSTEHLEQIGLVDLYTLLGNAIDNAIESVEAIPEEDKRTISLSIRDQAGMLYFQVENYYLGEIQLEQGLPLTHKWDKDNHGFGVKSMQAIARRYNGTLQISTADQRFLLQVMLPLKG